jgi:hypothetical protein
MRLAMEHRQIWGMGPPENVDNTFQGIIEICILAMISKIGNDKQSFSPIFDEGENSE